MRGDPRPDDARVGRPRTRYLRRVSAERQSALPVALAHDRDGQALKVDVVDVKGDRLGHACAGSVEQFEECPISQSRGRLEVAACGEQPLDIGVAQSLRKPAANARRLHVGARVGRGQAFGGRKSVKSAHRDNDPCRTRRRQPAPGALRRPQRCREVGKVILRNPIGIDEPAGRTPLRVPAQITAVRGDRVLRQPALDDDVVQIPVDRLVEGCTQARTSLNGSSGRSKDSATAAYVICPS